jgi:mitochondrial fusion and transport protein UGO1
VTEGTFIAHWHSTENMAAISQKRRRDQDETRRPKKKFKKVKRVDYHSSSDDDSDQEDTSIARDAPRGPKIVREKATGINAIPVAATKPKPKSILKQVPQPVEEEREDDEEIDEIEALERNTIYNGIVSRVEAKAEAQEEWWRREREAKEEPEPESRIEDERSADEDEEVEDDEPDLASTATSSDDDDEDDDDDNEDATSSTTASETSSTAARTKKKRNDPTAFATSITRILDTKLTTSKRSDPVLSRSKSASEANRTLSDHRLETKARAQLRAERKAALNKGRVEDVLGLDSEGVDTGRVVEEEKKLKKVAQRGVVKLFNAVRAAQVKGEEAMRVARAEGVVGVGQREERVREMSKQGFLDLISGGQKTAV